MRIAIVWGDDVYADYQDLVGTEAKDECRRLCAALTALGHTVTGHPREGVGPPAPVASAKVLPFVGDWAAELSRQWAGEPPDVVHSFGWLGGLAAQLAAQRNELITVQSFHGLAATTSVPGKGHSADAERTRLEPLLIRGAAWVTGGSSEELDVLTKLRRNRARTSVLSSGVDVDRYACSDRAWADHATHRIVQVAPNLQPCNGFDKTIQVLPHVPDSDLVIAETSANDARNKRERTKLKRMATELGVAKRVHFTGYIAPDELPPLFWSADVVACTPRLAPRATSALQAMASGRVVVGTAVGALMDTVIGNVTGVLVSPTKPHELAGALKAMQQQRFQRQSMGSAGRSRATSRFTWDRIAQDTLSIYHQASRARISAIA